MAPPDATAYEGWLERRFTKDSCLMRTFGGRYRWQRQWCVLTGTDVVFRDSETSEISETVKLDDKCGVEINGPDKLGLVITITNEGRSIFCRCATPTITKTWVGAMRGAKAGQNKLRGRTLVDVKLDKDIAQGLGLSVTGGINSGNIAKTAIFVSNVIQNGPADEEGTIEKGDIIIEVEGHSLDNITHEKATSILHNLTPGSVRMKIAKRRKSRADIISGTKANDATPVATTATDGNRPATEGSASSASAAENGDCASKEGGENRPMTADEEREAKKAKLRAARLARKESQHLEILEALSVIDDLPED